MRDMPEELEKLMHLCIFCKKSLASPCGAWIAYSSGCCVGAEWKETRYIFRRGAHIYCLTKNFHNNGKKPKLWLTEKEVKKVVASVR
jgi:hypothetical protein